MSEALYEVTTWDPETGQFTPQEGLPPGPFPLFGLRAVLRQLREMGYEGTLTDYSVMIVRVA